MREKINIVLLIKNQILCKGLSLFLEDKKEFKVLYAGDNYEDQTVIELIQQTDWFIFQMNSRFEKIMILSIRRLLPNIKLMMLSKKDQLVEDVFRAGKIKLDAVVETSTDPEKLIKILKENNQNIEQICSNIHSLPYNIHQFRNEIFLKKSLPFAGNTESN